MVWAKLYQDDALTAMKRMKDDSIDMCMCSPPYWSLRDYGIEGQLGLEASLEEYVRKLASYFHELKRVLKKTGSFYLNLGDTYVNKNLQMIPVRVAVDLQKDGWILRNDVIWYKPNHMPASVKDRLTNTYEHLFHFVKTKKYYFNLDCIRIPHKTCPSSTFWKREPKRCDSENFVKASVKDMQNEVRRKTDSRLYRYDTKFDRKSQIYNLLQNTAYARKVLGKAHDTAMNHPLGKNPGDTFALSAERAIELNRARGKLRSNGSVAGHYLDLSDASKHYADSGKNPGDVFLNVELKKYKGIVGLRQDKNLGGKVGLAEYRDICRKNGIAEGHELGQNPGDFWEVKPKPFKGAHFAVYPEALCIRPILSSCPPAGIVLDPFAGSGTTIKVAVELGRNAIGIELNKNYLQIIADRVGNNVIVETK